MLTNFNHNRLEALHGKNLPQIDFELWDCLDDLIDEKSNLADGFDEDRFDKFEADAERWISDVSRKRENDRLRDTLNRIAKLAGDTSETPEDLLHVAVTLAQCATK